VTSPIRSHRAAGAAIHRSKLLLLAVVAVGSTGLLTWYGTSGQSSSAEFEDPVTVPSDASPRIDPTVPDVLSADPTATGSPRPRASGDPDGGGGSSAAAAAQVPEDSAGGSGTVLDANAGGPCQPEGATGRTRSGVVVRCVTRPGDRQPHWRRVS